MAIHKNESGRGIHQPGQYQVQNDTVDVLTKGTVVQITGLNGLITVAPVDNPTTNNILGVVTDNIQPSEAGYVARLGLFGQFDTSAFSVNDVLYSDGTGNLTTTALGPKIGLVLASSATNGHIQMDVVAESTNNGAGYNTLVTTILQGDIDNGYINLPVAPGTPSATIVTLTGAPTQTYGLDFTVVGIQLNFNQTDPGDLGNILTASDTITIMYK